MLFIGGDIICWVCLINVDNLPPFDILVGGTKPTPYACEVEVVLKEHHLKNKQVVCILTKQRTCTHH